MVVYPPFLAVYLVYRIPYTLNISFIINIFEILYQWSQSQIGSDLWSLTHLINFLKDKAAAIPPNYTYPNTKHDELP